WFAAGESGVLRLNDSGSSWKNVLGDVDVYALLATESGLYAGTAFQGIWKSTDHGDSWIGLQKGLPVHYDDSTKKDSFYFRIVGFALSGNNLFAGSLDG